MQKQKEQSIKELEKKKNNPINKQDLQFNITRANEIVRLYENRKKYFLHINLALMSAFLLIYRFFWEIYRQIAKDTLTVFLLIFLFITLANILWILKRNETKNTVDTLSKDDIGKGDNKLLLNTNKNISDDYKNQLINLYRFQKNYDKIARKSKDLTLIATVIFISGFIASLIFNYNTEITSFTAEIFTLAFMQLLMILYLLIILKNCDKLEDLKKRIFKAFKIGLKK